MRSVRPSVRPLLLLVFVAVFLVGSLGSPLAAARFPSIVLITVDTLRADRMSAYGYHRLTTPNVDRLLSEGVRWSQARTVEPLTNPALSSMITSRYPHEHGASRNGLTLRPGLPSFTGQLTERGFASAAFVGNWTLKDEISGLAEHFEEYHEVFSRKRWFVLKGEATAEDITERALDWLEEQTADAPDRPVLLWVHYVEPHAPYRTQRSVLDQIGLPPRAQDLPRSDRYDSEVAFVDRSIGRLIDGVDELIPPTESVVLFTADHGESLGEHGYWGHGRDLHEPGLHIPMGVRWQGTLEPGIIDQPATILDVGPTLLGLIGYPVDSSYVGWDWSSRLLDPDQPPIDERPTFLQAHKGAVQSIESQTKARQRGLLQVGLLHRGVKEILDLAKGVSVYDLSEDPAELRPHDGTPAPSTALARWRELVLEGLEGADDLPVPSLGAEDEEQMRALGYLD